MRPPTPALPLRERHGQRPANNRSCAAHIHRREVAAGRQLPDEAAKEFLQALEIQPDAIAGMARTTARWR